MRDDGCTEIGAGKNDHNIKSRP